MQLMSDAVTVLGSRHGIFIEPNAEKAYMIRGGCFPGIPFQLIAGLEIDGKTITLPLSTEEKHFAFHDQDTSPCSMKLTGIDPQTRTKLELTMTSPFQPRNADVSTMPVLDLRLKLSQLTANFRWTGSKKIESPGKIFLSIQCDDFNCVRTEANSLHFSFQAPLHTNRRAEQVDAYSEQNDAIVTHKGTIEEQRITAEYTPDSVEAEIHASWCAYSEKTLRIHGQAVPFKYMDNFANLESVISHVKENPDEVHQNAENVDRILQSADFSSSTHHLMSTTLHSWMANTWWTKQGDRDWFSVWEGSCYYHSTIDVEYTQTPFYLNVWPELLKIELNNWPDFVTPGENVLERQAQGTIVFMHDMGALHEIDTTRYNHYMPVEENTNYILMSYAYWKRTGDDSTIRKHARTIKGALDFLLACDTTGNGVPDMGMANTIDDASPAVQFGKEQVYLAVKTLASLDVGTEILNLTGDNENTEQYLNTARKIASVIKEKGWSQDHFVTLLDKSTHGVVNSWNKRKFEGDKLPGWDSAHIYTANGLALLDMVGRKTMIDDDLLKKDLINATQSCMCKFGCKHSAYGQKEGERTIGEGGETLQTNKRGWISMNILRDISALYRGIDFRHLTDRYWDYQVLVNSQGPFMFFETFNGNNLMCYPRGIAIFGLYDAITGLTIDMTENNIQSAPLNKLVQAPMLLTADWQNGTADMIGGENSNL